MGRPDYDDAIAGGNNDSSTSGDSTGWLQHGQDSDGVEFRGV